MRKYHQVMWIIMALLLPLQLQAANEVVPGPETGSTAGVIMEAPVVVPAQTAESSDDFLSVNMVWIIMTLLMAIPFFTILRKTGLHPALAALLFVPALGFVIVMAILAFARWPNLDEEEPVEENP